MLPARAALLRHFTRALGSAVFITKNDVFLNPGPSGKLQGKIALVTASTEGIGFAAARGLAQQGALVVLSSRQKDKVDRAVAELRSQNLNVTGTTCHVGKREDRERLVATTVRDHGGIDILVSNAAVNPFFGNIMDSTEEVWDKILDVNVKATFLLAKLVVPHMEARGGGSIVIISSIAGYQPFQALGPYSVSKTALLGLTKALAPELAHMNIRVNGVAPGLIQTKFSSAVSVCLCVCLCLSVCLSVYLIGSPDDISGTVSFLCSDDASYITGETIVVAGGMNARL
ncbi:dehydrogenase/reductase SDR family member 4-like [Acipenser oxyrinchus oxyrinchus]|uniref:Dehydrogenase/reductase SDR family member 4-like n=1 Tax=Acipenser oxyrinchus oxyrinchus TaxID=40147 RepID=A0AAD8CKX0_ACIOX|nr:dehydrogenase/reductase SDR family member 4-like [Acipenser oxyrinchus oxyrinchus]